MERTNKKFFHESKHDVFKDALFFIYKINENKNGTKTLLLKLNSEHKTLMRCESKYLNTFDCKTFNYLIDIASRSNLNNILIDCELLHTINSIRLKFLFRLIKDSKKPVTLVNVCKNITALLDFCGIKKLITLHNDTQKPYFH
ncbi:MAG: hypothetical protein OXC48_01355 [Endozoicomonadaceae bacterium]|nr:hypothetical protein [Endozoicomonadaceae bacterium]